jgi:hypothetical protein
MKFDPVKRDFVFEADERAALDLQAATWDQNQEWSVMGEAIERMLVLRHPYQSWVTRFFETSSISEVAPYPTIAVEDYVGTSVEGSPFQTPRYIRPTFLWKHSTSYWAGGAAYYHMNDTRIRGWDPLARIAAQIAEEQAKKLDTHLLAILDAVIPAGQKITASAMDFDTFQDIVRDASDTEWDVNYMISTKGRAMDTATWGTQNLTWMWAPLGGQYANQVASQGFITNFMGVQLEQHPSMASTAVYFFGNNAEHGRMLETVGPMTRLSDQNIETKTVRFNFDQQYQVTCIDASDVWKVTIS